MGLWKHVSEKIALNIGLQIYTPEEIFLGWKAAPYNMPSFDPDTLCSWQNCESACECVMKEGRSVVVDITNPDLESRKRYVDVSPKAGVPCRCFNFTTSLELSKHNNRFCEMVPSATKQAPVNDLVFHCYKSLLPLLCQKDSLKSCRSTFYPVSLTVDLRLFSGSFQRVDK
ncbi:hypothetical protein AOLI_G00323960 [Acnodon oligacanthus]